MRSPGDRRANKIRVARIAAIPGWPAAAVVGARRRRLEERDESLSEAGEHGARAVKQEADAKTGH